MNRLALGFALCSVASVASADVWVWEPSAALDQRFDDNYTISASNPASVSATRAVGSLGLSRESRTFSLQGLARIDGLLTLGNDGSDGAGGDLNSNQILVLDTDFKRERWKVGLSYNYKRDTPSRDISSDITDLSVTAADTGASVTQTENVARGRTIWKPSWSYNLSRRATVDAELSHTIVHHTKPSVADSIRKQYELGNPGQPIPDDLSIDSVGVFTVADELDDFFETALDIAYRYNLSRISTFSMFVGYSRFNTKTEADPAVRFPFEDKIPDSDERQILRNPKRKATSETTKLRIGWERSISPTLNFGIQVGLFETRFDNSDLFRADDLTDITAADRLEKLANGIGKQQGYLGSLTVTRTTNVSSYSGKLGFDVFPSDAGSQVESFEAVGDYKRKLGPLLDFSVRLRAYEPDAINAQPGSDFSRRFFSFEPKLVWQLNRSWALASSYRYRRQKSEQRRGAGQSNALLFSIKYTPPSEIRDLNSGS